LGVERSSAAVVVVVFDLLMAFTLWYSMVLIRPILEVTHQEVDMNTVTTEDFSV